VRRWLLGGNETRSQAIQYEPKTKAGAIGQDIPQRENPAEQERAGPPEAPRDHDFMITDEY
jgi:hypothetical protein